MSSNTTYYQGEVKYVLVSAPLGMDVPYLDSYETMVVGGKNYFLSEHTFYQKITRDGQPVYVVVDPPYGAKVRAIPEYAVKVEVSGQTYYRWDRNYYQRATDKTGGYIVVRQPA